MTIAAHAYFGSTATDESALESDLAHLVAALDATSGPAAAPRPGRPNSLKSILARLDSALSDRPDAATRVELGIPYHPDHLDLRPARITLDAVRGEHAFLYAFGRYQPAMFTITTAWPIARQHGTILRGVVVAPTTEFSRHLPGYPSPFSRYMALLRQLDLADALRIPTLLVAVEPG